MIAPRKKHRGEDRTAGREQPGNSGPGPDDTARRGNWSVPGEQPDGSPIALQRTDGPQSLLATITLLVLRQIDAEAVTVATTFDAAGANGSRLRPDVDAQLVEQTQAYLRSLRSGGEPGPGVRRAWEQFYRLHHPLIGRVVGACRLSAQDAEDCIQEVWTAIVRRVPQFERDPSKGRFCSWIARLIHNQVVDFVRKVSRRAARRVALPEETPANGDSDPVAAYCRGERRRLVRHVLGHLEEQVSETNYRLVHLRWIQGQDLPAVADELGLSPQQVWYRHHRVKKRLRRLLKTHDGAWP